MSSRFTASRHSSFSNRRIYINPNKTKHSLVISQEIVDQSESDSQSDSECSSDFGSSKDSSVSFCTSELTERSNSIMNSSIQLGKGEGIMGKYNKQSSIHIHLRDKSKENSNSMKVHSAKNWNCQKNTLSQINSLKTNTNSTKNINTNTSSLLLNTESSKSDNPHILSNKSVFQITIKGHKDGTQSQFRDQVSLTKPKTKLHESFENQYCDEIAYTNLKLKQKTDILEGVSDYLSTTAKQGTNNNCKPKKKLDSNQEIRSFNSEIISNNKLPLSEYLFEAPKNSLFTNSRSFKESYLEDKQGNDSISRLSQVNNGVQRRITRSQSEVQKLQSCLDCSNRKISTKNGKNNRNKKNIENDEAKKNGRKKDYQNRDRYDYVEDNEKSTDIRGKQLLDISNEKQVEEAYSSVQTSVTQFKQMEDTIREDWKEANGCSSNLRLLDQGVIPKNMMLKRPFFLFDENESNTIQSKSNDETELNIWLRNGEDNLDGQDQQRVTGEEKNWNVWKKSSRDQDVSVQEIDLKSLKQQSQNKKKLKKTAVQTTTDYEKIRYTSQLKGKSKFFEFNCFRDRDLRVPHQYMNKLQDITIDDDVMTDDETLTTYVEVCFTDLLEGIEMEQKHKDGVDHLWEYFNPPELS